MIDLENMKGYSLGIGVSIALALTVGSSIQILDHSNIVRPFDSPFLHCNNNTTASKKQRRYHKEHEYNGVIYSLMRPFEHTAHLSSYCLEMPVSHICQNSISKASRPCVCPDISTPTLCANTSKSNSEYSLTRSVYTSFQDPFSGLRLLFAPYAGEKAL